MKPTGRRTVDAVFVLLVVFSTSGPHDISAAGKNSGSEGIHTRVLSPLPNPVEFGNVTVGDSADQTLTIFNVSVPPEDVQVTDITITGAGGGDFSVVSPSSFPFTIPASGSQGVVLRFKPSAPATRTVTLTIASNELASTSSVTLNGSAIALPVQLFSMTAEQFRSQVLLTWQTAGEVNCYGFEVQRRQSRSGSNWEAIGFVEGHGTSTVSHRYAFTDKGIVRGEVYYRLKQIDKDGSFQYSFSVAIQIAGPAVFRLHANYPNPFNPETQITFDVPEAAQIRIVILDALGRQIHVLADRRFSAGYHKLAWKGADHNGNKVGSGIYFCRIDAIGESGTTFTKVMKMVMTK